MRIVHVADTHLGYRNFSGKLDPVRNLNQRECDVYDAWHAAINKAVELKPDLFIHAGDLFDSSRPTPVAVVQALEGFAKLRDAGIPAVVIAGNHSTPRFRSGGSVFQILSRFDITAVWQEPTTIHLNGVAVHCVPHEPHADQLLTDIQALPLDGKADANVLVVHAGLEGVRQDYHEVNEIELTTQELTEGDHDYIALGHLHRYQAPQVNAAYAGSLERLDFGDIEGDKGLVEVDLAAGAGNKNFLRRHAIPTRPMFDIPIACAGLSATEIVAALEQTVSDLDLEGAIIRLRFDAIQRDVYHALDLGAVDELFVESLYVRRQIGQGGLVVGGETADTDVSFAAFARRMMPPGVDPDEIVRLAQSFLDDAAEAEAEAVGE